MAVLLERKPASSVHGTEDSRSVPPRRHADHHAARRGRSASGLRALTRTGTGPRTVDSTGPGTTGHRSPVPVPVPVPAPVPAPVPVGTGTVPVGTTGAGAGGGAGTTGPAPALV